MNEVDMPQIFISYASPDRERVIPFFDELEANGLNVWMDCRKLMAGQNWNFEIMRALDKSSMVIIFLSEASVGRRGYVQREMKIALDRISEKLYEDIYIIPVILDNSIEIPFQLKSVHAVFARDNDCISQVINSVTFQLGRLGVELQRAQRRDDIFWQLTTKRESWDGLPGYEVELQEIALKSESFPCISNVSDLIQGWLVGELISNREIKFSQMPEVFNYGQDKFIRTNTFDAHTTGPSIKGRLMSIVYLIHTYGAGAAHPNTHYKTYSFVLEPLIHISGMEQIFTDQDAALVELKKHIRNELKALKHEDAENGEPILESGWVDRGTETWSDFSSFAFREKGVDVLFAPYHVGAYVCGPQVVSVPYDLLAPLLEPHYRSALQLVEGY